MGEPEELGEAWESLGSLGEPEGSGQERPARPLPTCSWEKQREMRKSGSTWGSGQPELHTQPGGSVRPCSGLVAIP